MERTTFYNLMELADKCRQQPDGHDFDKCNFLTYEYLNEEKPWASQKMIDNLSCQDGAL